jgi:S-adenosylmethionine decarboxylase
VFISLTQIQNEFLSQYFNGNAHVLGDPNGDHWHIYVADMAEAGAERKAHPTVEIMMSQLDRAAMAQFYKGELSAKDVTVSSGISEFLPGSVSDEVLFSPCGYSVNGLLGEAYYTIHVTPEPHCSFVSFESNVDLPCYTALVRRVLEAFRPGAFCLALSTERPYAAERLFDRDLPGYRRVHSDEHHLAGSFSVAFSAYRADEDTPPLSQ